MHKYQCHQVHKLCERFRQDFPVKMNAHNYDLYAHA